jgi:hypothetical protein
VDVQLAPSVNAVAEVALWKWAAAHEVIVGIDIGQLVDLSAGD